MHNVPEFMEESDDILMTQEAWFLSRRSGQVAEHTIHGSVGGIVFDKMEDCCVSIFACKKEHWR